MWVGCTFGIAGRFRSNIGVHMGTDIAIGIDF